MTRRARFGWWVAAVLGALAAPVWLIFGGGERVWLLAAVAQSLVSLTGMVWLLRTTPGDAIRLPGWASVVVIAGGSAWVMWHVFHDVAAAGFMGGMLALGGIVTLEAKRMWWCAATAWHPMWLCMTALTMDTSQIALFVLLLAMIGALATSLAGGKGDIRAQRASGWIWATSVVLTAACCAWV